MTDNNSRFCEDMFIWLYRDQSGDLIHMIKEPGSERNGIIPSFDIARRFRVGGPLRPGEFVKFRVTLTQESEVGIYIPHVEKENISSAPESPGRDDSSQDAGVDDSPGSYS